MPDQNSDQAHRRTSSNLSFDFQQLRMKLTKPPNDFNSCSAFQPPGINISYTDTPEIVFLLSSSTKKVENPLRAVYFPHWRVNGPGTTKCVGRPDRPKLSVNTDVPIVSISRCAHRYGTPWRSAAPARYGPREMDSANMCTWLKGPREDMELGELLSDPLADIEDDDGPWFEIDVSDNVEMTKLGQGEESFADSEEKSAELRLIQFGFGASSRL